MSYDIQTVSTQLAESLEVLKMEEDAANQAEEPSISTPLIEQVGLLIRVIMRYGARIEKFLARVKERNGWRLRIIGYKEKYRHDMSSGRYMLLLAHSEKRELDLGTFQYDGSNNNSRIHWAEDVLSAISALRAIPEVIREWRKDVQQKKEELAKKRVQWAKKRQEVKEELNQAEQDLNALCQELQKVSQEILNNHEMKESEPC